MQRIGAVEFTLAQKILHAQVSGWRTRSARSVMAPMKVICSRVWTSQSCRNFPARISKDLRVDLDGQGFVWFGGIKQTLEFRWQAGNGGAATDQVEQKWPRRHRRR